MFHEDCFQVFLPRVFCGSKYSKTISGVQRTNEGESQKGSKGADDDGDASRDDKKSGGGGIKRGCDINHKS